MRATRRHGGRVRYSTGRRASSSRPERRRLTRRISSFYPKRAFKLSNKSAINYCYCEKLQDRNSGPEIASLHRAAGFERSGPLNVTCQAQAILRSALLASVKKPISKSDELLREGIFLRTLTQSHVRGMLACYHSVLWG
jgi:hypothetical protein